ncbi:GntR family transcriptional regulator [Octadecabacter sp. SW4]|uniref:GntR family transcriptional regulator n=1 Tax=Octadecabacter sp. SW4 TaxID=2602067 RepID=UPI0011C2066C|nr:GntR family transcriptional regulator [Octadecabacter sp. SW4]QEE34435.1 GntR family transcriptional regulator [Octadecabacter sp. SW4]
MHDTLVIGESKSTADVIFEWLHGEIVTLAILPGSKISETDIARRFGVSRQPVRDAFRRLHNLDLLDIRPQRATVVRRFSLEEIEATRFVRLAVELEVIEGAAQLWDQARSDALAENLDEQSDALIAGDAGLFHELDYGFHKLICDLSDVPKAFETINQCKRKVDRLCVLSLSNDESVAEVLDDHRAIANALGRRSVQDARAHIRHHVGRLDQTIAEIHQTHTDFFQ